MGARTTPELVAGIIEVDDSIILTPFISAASSLVDRVEASAEARDLLQDGPGTGDKTREDKLQEIETFLAAHFYTLRDPRPTSESAGSVSSTYQSRVDLRLFTSPYGQMAVVLDETGTLEAIQAGNNGKQPRRAGMTWAGMTPDQIAEVDE